MTFGRGGSPLRKTTKFQICIERKFKGPKPKENLIWLPSKRQNVSTNTSGELEDIDREQTDGLIIQGGKKLTICYTTIDTHKSMKPNGILPRVLRELVEEPISNF